MTNFNLITHKQIGNKNNCIIIYLHIMQCINIHLISFQNNIKQDIDNSINLFKNMKNLKNKIKNNFQNKKKNILLVIYKIIKYKMQMIVNVIFKIDYLNQIILNFYIILQNYSFIINFNNFINNKQ